MRLSGQPVLVVIALQAIRKDAGNLRWLSTERSEDLAFCYKQSTCSYKQRTHHTHPLYNSRAAWKAEAYYWSIVLYILLSIYYWYMLCKSAWVSRAKSCYQASMIRRDSLHVQSLRNSPEFSRKRFMFEVVWPQNRNYFNRWHYFWSKWPTINMRQLQNNARKMFRGSDFRRNQRTATSNNQLYKNWLSVSVIN